MIRVAVCDDSEKCIADFKKAINLYRRKDECELHYFYTGKGILQWMSNHRLDVVFMDIELQGESGINLAGRLKEMRRDIVLVYYSFYDKYFAKMIRTEPFDFVQKPIVQDRFNKTMDRVFSYFDLFKKSQFRFSLNKITYMINLKDVIYFYSDHRTIFINLGDKTLRFYDKLDNVEKKVEMMVHFFVRVNKSYYVNMFEICRFSKTYVKVNDEKLSVTKKYVEDYFQKMHYFDNLYK